MPSGSAELSASLSGRIGEAVPARNPDNCSMRDKLTRRNLIVIMAAGAISFGVAAWLMLGPLWTVAGVAAGVVIALAAVVIALLLTHSDASDLATEQPEQALKQLQFDVSLSRRRESKRLLPWRYLLAARLVIQSHAHQQLRQYEQALRSIDEAVEIYQGLAAQKPRKYAAPLADALDRQSGLLSVANRTADAIAVASAATRLYRNLATAEPGKYLPRLASALTWMATWLADMNDDKAALAVVHEASQLYQHRLPSPAVSSDHARAALLEGRLLLDQGRRDEAVTLLARGWQLAAARHQSAILSDAVPTLKAVHRLNPRDFTAVWRAETGTDPPDWLGDLER
jgi:tetratricopeptide (TPR) repeat protein